MSIPIAILASGRGSNFDAILSAVRGGSLKAEIRAVLSDRKDAPVLGKAREAGIPALCVEPERGGDLETRRRLHDEQVLRVLEPYGARFLVMAGYMRVMTGTLLERFRSERGYFRVTNIHPSLLPAFPGVDSYGQAYRYGAKVAGVTVHLVSLGVDEGPILAQEAFAIGDCRSVEQVEQRGLEVEHRLYPETLAWALEERFGYETVEGRGFVRSN